MFDIRRAALSLVAAKNLTTKEKIHIKDFARIEIQPFRFGGYGLDGREILEPCDVEKVNTWAVCGYYGHYGNDSGFEILEAFDTKGEALRYYFIVVNVHPAFDRRRPRRPMPQGRPAPRYAR